MSITDTQMTSHHWLRAVMAQNDLQDLIGECVAYLESRGRRADAESEQLNSLLQERMPLHPNGEDMLDLCKATGLYEAVVAAADKYDAENARPLKVVRES